jgi:hypothetical protein
MSIPLRNFGKAGVQISALGLGGHHLGGAKDEKSSTRIWRSCAISSRYLPTRCSSFAITANNSTMAATNFTKAR